jgi:hypothetical protein
MKKLSMSSADEVGIRGRRAAELLLKARRGDASYSDGHRNARIGLDRGVAMAEVHVVRSRVRRRDMRRRALCQWAPVFGESMGDERRLSGQ